MGDVARTYTREISASPTRRGPGCALWVVPLVVAALVGGYFYATRDSVPPARLIPSDAAALLALPDLVSKRALVLDSPLWSLVPDEAGAEALRTAIRDFGGVPEWVVNNVVPGSGYVAVFEADPSGEDGAAWLGVSRMSRIGVLLERIGVLLGSVQRDNAGGLGLRTLPDAGLYYAVRGRVLALSASREVLVRALTVPEVEAFPAPFEALTQRDSSALAHVWGRPVGIDAVGGILGEGSGSIWLAGDGLRIAGTATLADALQPATEVLFDGIASGTLPAPAPGAIEISVDLGIPAQTLWQRGIQAGLWEAPGASGQTDGDPIASDASATALPDLESMLAPLDARGYVSWVDLLIGPILPAPQVRVRIDADGDAAQALFEQFPPYDSAGAELVALPGYDAARQQLVWAFAGGPALHLSAAVAGDRLHVDLGQWSPGSDAQAAPPETDLAEPGNVFVRVRPAELRAWYQAMVQDLEPVATPRLPWLQELARDDSTWARIDALGELSLLLAWEDDALRFDLRVQAAPAL